MKNYYTLQEVAEALECTIPTVYSYEKKGYIQKVADPHNLYGTSRFEAEGVEQLKKEKEKLETAGRSITEAAARLGVYPQKVKEAISLLKLDVSQVPTGVQSAKVRYALTSEQEKEIGQHLKRQKTTRIKRNHLYFSASDLALYQSFLVAGEQPVRLRRNELGEFGFYLDDRDFVPYLSALRSLDLEPRYAIHQERQGAQKGFTDLTVPLGKKAFYQILDALYAVCGVENFNAEVRNGHLIASIRNGAYAVNEVASPAALSVLQRAIKTGKVERDGSHWVFTRSDRTVQLTFTEEVYEELERLAKEEGLSIKDWAQRVLEEKQMQFKKP